MRKTDVSHMLDVFISLRATLQSINANRRIEEMHVTPMKKILSDLDDHIVDLTNMVKHDNESMVGVKKSYLERLGIKL